jgi:hypothetical protein
MAQEWIALDNVIVAVQGSVVRAAQRTAERPGEIQYAVGEFNIAFPVEMQIEGEDPVTRFPPPVGSEEPAVPESHLSRVSFNLRPTISHEAGASVTWESPRKESPSQESRVAQESPSQESP